MKKTASHGRRGARTNMKGDIVNIWKCDENRWGAQGFGACDHAVYYVDDDSANDKRRKDGFVHDV